MESFFFQHGRHSLKFGGLNFGISLGNFVNGDGGRLIFAREDDP
jgi:hypothetical protein